MFFFVAIKPMQKNGVTVSLKEFKCFFFFIRCHTQNNCLSANMTGSLTHLYT